MPVGNGVLKHFDFDAFGHGGVAVRQVAATELVAPSRPICLALRIFARYFHASAAALDDALGNLGEFRVNRVGFMCCLLAKRYDRDFVCAFLIFVLGVFRRPELWE